MSTFSKTLKFNQMSTLNNFASFELNNTTTQTVTGGERPWEYRFLSANPTSDEMQKIATMIEEKNEAPTKSRESEYTHEQYCDDCMMDMDMDMF